MENTAVGRFWVALFAMASGLALIAVAPPPSILGTPTVLIYPFAVNGSDVGKEAGSRLAVTIAEKISALGGVHVKPAPPGVERQSYLSTAHHEGVDYYIAGYVTPLGDGVSVVEQLVSAQTGIVVYSNTAQVHTYADVDGQGDVLRDALLRHQTRNLSAYITKPPTAAAPSPTPASGPQANLGRLFGRKQKRSSAPGPSPAPESTTAAAGAKNASGKTPAPARAVAAETHATAAPAPEPSAVPTAAAVAAAKRGSNYALLSIGGSAASDRRTFTGDAIRNVMLAKHQRVAGPVPSAESACGDVAVGTLLGGNLATSNHTILGERETTATLELLAYDCGGSVIYRKTFARDVRGDWRSAVDRVVQTAVAEFLHDPPASRPG